MSVKSVKVEVKEYRRFGLSVGSVFCILGGLLNWRGYDAVSYGAVAVGLLLLLGGFLRPPVLRLPFKGWMKFARALGWFNTRLILTIFFYLVITPVAFVLMLLGKRPLQLRPDRNAASYWIRRPKEPFDPQACEKHF